MLKKKRKPRNLTKKERRGVYRFIHKGKEWGGGSLEGGEGFQRKQLSGRSGRSERDCREGGKESPETPGRTA